MEKVPEELRIAYHRRKMNEFERKHEELLKEMRVLECTYGETMESLIRLRQWNEGMAELVDGSNLRLSMLIEDLGYLKVRVDSDYEELFDQKREEILRLEHEQENESDRYRKEYLKEQEE